MLKIINLVCLIALVGYIPLIICLNYSTMLFFIGLVGIVWNKRNFIIMLLCIEMMFFSIGLNLIFLSLYLYNVYGQILVLFIITVAAAETAIGLSLLVIAYRLTHKITYVVLVNLRG